MTQDIRSPVIPDETACSRCGKFLDDCACRCPYCGGSEECLCAVGPETVTGG